MALASAFEVALKVGSKHTATFCRLHVMHDEAIRKVKFAKDYIFHFNLWHRCLTVPTHTFFNSCSWKSVTFLAK